MRTITAVLVVFAIAGASLIWGLSGFGSVFGQTDPISGLESGETLQDEAAGSVVNESGQFNASAEGSDSDNIVGLIIAGLGFVVDTASLVALLPFELERLGFPYYFAYPVGLLAQLIASVGVVQFGTGRVWR